MPPAPKKISVIIRKVASRRELKKAFSIRLRVFVREQGVPREIELDEDDARAIHVLAKVDDATVGTARVVMRGGGAKIGRMAVLRRYRGKGIGKQLLKRAVTLAKRNCPEVIFLHAQVPVVGFYQKMSFRCVGRSFTEAGIPHRKMILDESRTLGLGAKATTRSPSLRKR